MDRVRSSERLLDELSHRGHLPWLLEWLLLAVATVNLIWVLFDLSYLRLRDYYLLHAPSVATWYDPFKGVEPHDLTARYLQSVDELKTLYAQPQPDPRREGQLLTSLRSQSTTIINENPFLLSEKQGQLERIKNRIRIHVFNSRRASSTQSFQRFWTAENLTPGRRANELAFFDRELRPLFAVNYFRHYAEDGDFVDEYWWRIDRWFLIVFAAEFLLRTLTSKLRAQLTWRSAVGANFWDLLTLLPAINLIPGVHLGWLALGRIFTYCERLEHMGIFPSPVAYLLHRYSLVIADEVTDLVVVKVLRQMEDALQQTDFSRLLPETPSIIGNGNRNPAALDGFVREQANLLVRDILPQVRPELERFISHNVQRAIPLPLRLTTPLARMTVNAAYGAANLAIQEDPEGERLLQELLSRLLLALGMQWRQHGTGRDVQELLIALLRQVRQDYVARQGLDRPQG